LPRPSRADRTLLPALLAALLLALLVLQFAMPATVALPDVAPAAAPPLPARRVPVVTADPVLLDRALFARSRNATTGAAAGTGAALGGANAVGYAATRGMIRLFLQEPDGTLRTLAPGNVYQGWRLMGVSPRSARFERDGQRIELPLAPSKPPIAKADPSAGTEPEEEQQ
jgi:hypothetical protein